MPRCDACSARPITLWWDEERGKDFDLCGHHSDKHAAGLVASGYQLVVDERVEELHPSLGPVTTDPATH